MNTSNRTAFDIADVQALSFETEILRQPPFLTTAAKPSDRRSSRRLLRKLLTMRSALLSEI